MAKRYAALLLAASVFVFSGAAPSQALDETDCTGTPPQAVTMLPKPLDRWGEIACTPFGHVLTGKKGWHWFLPTPVRPVIVPSQMVDRMPAPLGNKSYFTAIDVTPVHGDEFEQAYQVFHQGFDPKESLPTVYRVDLTSVSGKTKKLYFFDYDTYAWGMECVPGGCSRDSRFLILDEDHVPLPRGDSI